MRVCVPASEAKIQASHESDIAIYETKLLVMGPVENNVFVYPIQCLESIGWHVGELEGLQREILNARYELRVDDLA